MRFEIADTRDKTILSHVANELSGTVAKEGCLGQMLGEAGFEMAREDRLAEGMAIRLQDLLDQKMKVRALVLVTIG